MAVKNETFGSVAVIADIHGNLFALDAVLSEPRIANADSLVIVGDHAAGPQPAEVLNRLRSLGEAVSLVRGNSDRELVELGRGRDMAVPEEVTRWAASQLSAADISMLEALPHPLVMSVPGFGPVLICHGSPRRDDEVVLVDSRLERWHEVFEGLDPEIRTVVCGHTHMPFMRLVNGRLVLNPGSVGMPYGRTDPSWIILEQGIVTIGYAPVDSVHMGHEIAEASLFPGVETWVADYVIQPATDIDALEAFGPMDGRVS